MLTAYTGVPGGGKSLHAAQEIMDAIRCKGIPVIANFDVNREKLYKRGLLARKEMGEFYYLSNEQITPEMLVAFSKAYYSNHKFNESGILLILDEAQILYNSRSWSEAGRSDWIYFYTNSRHFGVRVILICQFLEMLDKQIRSVIETEVRHRNMANFGLAGKIISLCVGGKLFACVTYYCGLKQRIGVQYVLGRRHLYDFYDSYDTESFAR